MTNLVLLIGLVLVGPDDCIGTPTKDFYIIIDSTSKDELIKYKSMAGREFFTPILPQKQYYINSHYNIKFIEKIDYQAQNTPLPAFKFGKNGEWHEFCPGTFAANSTFTLSLYYLLKWTDINDELSMWNKDKTIPELVSYFPNDFLDFYDFNTTVTRYIELKSYWYNDKMSPYRDWDDVPKWLKDKDFKQGPIILK